jgi:23S rRNA (cytosine1962-C5)-methyltransferase
LPGLVVDRFGDILVVQLASATMEKHKDDVVAALVQVCKPSGILFKNDSAARDAEGLSSYVETAFGLVPEWVALEENGVKFEAPVIAGQKTGWFYDHRMNRARIAPYVKGKRVLDLFSYIGGWGVQAAAFGASDVMCVDASAFALDGVERNAGLNGLNEKVACLEGDVFEALKQLKAAEERFDVVIVDPPAFIKRKKDLKNGEAAYRRLNEQAMRLLNKDGILVSASCSMHLPEDDLQNILLTSARHLDRNMQLLERGSQGPDHPVHPAIPETRYIKSLTCRLLPNN